MVKKENKKRDAEKPKKKTEKMNVSENIREKSLKDSGLDQLAKVLSGETELRKREEKIKKLKEEAIEKQKRLNRARVTRGEVVLEKEEDFDDISEKREENKVVQKITLYEWEAPIRLKFSYDSKTFMTVVALTLVFILYLALLGHYGLMFSLLALLFFIYVAGTTDPIEVEHTVTTRGIETLGKLYEWYMLEDFWFTKKNDQYMLIIETKLRVPGKLMMLIDEADVTAAFLLLQDKLLYKDIKKYSKVDGLAYGEYIPLEDV